VAKSVVQDIKWRIARNTARRFVFLLIICAGICGGFLLVLFAQDGGGFDGGGYSSYGDPGYAVYGDTSPYPTGNEPLPGLDGGSTAGGSSSTIGQSAPSSMPNGQGGGTSPAGSGFSVANSEGNTASGTPYINQPNPPVTPELWPAPSDPAIDQAKQQLDPNTPNDVRRQYQDLLRTQQDQYQKVFGDPSGNARELANDLLGAAGGIHAPTFSPFNPAPLSESGGDTIPFGAEQHSQLIELGKTNDAIHNIWQQYGVPELRGNPVDPQFDPTLNERYTVQPSDSAPFAVGQKPNSTTPGFDARSLFQMQMSGSPLDFGLTSSSNTIAGGPIDPGGIDFRSVRCVFLSEHDLSNPGSSEIRKLRFGLQAVISKGGPRISFRQGSNFSEKAFSSFLSIPDGDLWVNLHPGEPDRIISTSLGETEVGLVMLKADLQLKRDAGLLMRQQPFADAERKLVDSVLSRNGRSIADRASWGSTGRVEITSATSQVFARESQSGIMIEGVVLDVVFEQKGFRVAVGPKGFEHDLKIERGDWETFLALSERLIRPQLIRRVNQAPQYEELRQAFAARVLADWYKRKWSHGGALSHLINAPSSSSAFAQHVWDPKAIWLEFKRDYDHGAVRGFGGVSFDRMPLFRALNRGISPSLPLLAQSLAFPNGMVYRSVYRTGATIIGVHEVSRVRIAARWLIALALVGAGLALLWQRGRYL